MLGLLLLVAAGPLDSVTDADRTAIQAAISGQIQAFGRDDGTAAFGFAAPTIQQLFGTPENFLGMVRRAYQPVYRPRDVTFGALVDVDGGLVQRVELLGPDGQPHLALYSMEHEADGTWRISGCELTQSEAVGA